MALGLNLNSAIRYIHWTPPGELDGLYQLAAAKCLQLGISPGRRSAMTPENPVGAGEPSCNVRGIINFINSVEPLTDADKVTDADRVVSDGKPGDSHEVLLKKASVRAGQEEHLKIKTAEYEAKKTAQATLLSLYATLASRCAAAGYKPAEPLPLEVAGVLPRPVTSPLATSMPLASDRTVVPVPGPAGTVAGVPAGTGRTVPGTGPTVAPGTTNVPAGTAPAAVPGTAPAAGVHGTTETAPGTAEAGRRGRGTVAATPAGVPAGTVPAGTVPAARTAAAAAPVTAPGRSTAPSPSPKPLA